MAEVVHEHVTHDTSSTNAMSFVFGIAFLIVLAILAFYFFGANGFFTGSTSTTDSSTSAPQVNVPEKIDVNVNR